LPQESKKPISSCGSRGMSFTMLRSVWRSWKTWLSSASARFASSRPAMSDAKVKPTGPVAFVIGADPEKKIVIFQFSKVINRLEFTPLEAMQIAGQIVSRAAVAAGKTVTEMAHGGAMPDTSRQTRDELYDQGLMPPRGGSDVPSKPQ
jgi:hypothetical protein